MTAHKTTIALGRRVYGVGMMGLGVLGLAWRDFLPGQPVTKSFPHRVALAVVAGLVVLVGSAAVEWRRTAAWGAATLTAYYTLIVIFMMNGRLLLTHYGEYGMYSNIAEQLSLAAGGLIVFATTASIDAGLSRRLVRVGQMAFAACALLFGGAHFVYMNLTAPLVPKWLPPSQLFWGCATGAGFVVAGAAMLVRVQARLAAILITAMLACFALLVHWPMLLTDRSRMNWSEAAINFAILGAAWLVADSFSARV